MDVEKSIQALLDKIEQEYQVEILLAVESGSRAWGFPSKDSDYDIRFIYVHPPEWYLSVFPKRDVIENMFLGDLDAAGWDVRKSLQLLKKGNAALLEWLDSPVVYRSKRDKLGGLYQLAERTFSPPAAFHHYLSLAKGKMESDKLSTHFKTFLYVLRAILCAKWVKDNNVMAPVLFDKLIDKYLKGFEKQALDTLLKEKLTIYEGDISQVPESLLNYVKSLYNDLSSATVEPGLPRNSDEFESVFLSILQKG